MKIQTLAVGVTCFLLAGCIGGSDSGGDTSVDDGKSPGDDVGQQEEGTVQIQFQRKIDTQTEEMFTQSLDEASMVRIVIQNPETSFKVVEDYPVPETVDATLSVPVGDGYKVAGVSYKEDALRFDRNLVLKMKEKDGIAVDADTVANVSLVLEAPDISVNIPDTVNEGELVTVSFEEHSSDFIRDFFYVLHDMEPVGFPDFSEANNPAGNSEVEFNAPSVETEEKMYVLVRHFLKGSYRRDSEHFNNFQYFSPDQAVSSDQFQIDVMPEEGQIGVDVEY